MVPDDVTFFAAFGAIAALLGAYLWHLERAARRLAERVDELEARAEPDGSKRA